MPSTTIRDLREFLQERNLQTIRTKIDRGHADERPFDFIIVVNTLDLHSSLSCLKSTSIIGAQNSECVRHLACDLAEITLNFIDDARDEIKQIIETCRTENPKLNEARQTISEQLARTADAKNTAVQSNSEFMRLSRAEAAWAAMLGLTACDPYVSVRVVALQTELAAPDPADVIKKMSETLRRWLANTRIS